MFGLFDWKDYKSWVVREEGSDEICFEQRIFALISEPDLEGLQSWFQIRVFKVSVIETKKEYFLLLLVRGILENRLRKRVGVFWEIRSFWYLYVKLHYFIRLHSNNVVWYVHQFLWLRIILVKLVYGQSSEYDDLILYLDRIRQESTRIVQCLNLHPLVVCRKVEFSQVVRNKYLLSTLPLFEKNH